jgi:hypothetical protein
MFVYSVWEPLEFARLEQHRQSVGSAELSTSTRHYGHISTVQARLTVSWLVVCNPYDKS